MTQNQNAQAAIDYHDGTKHPGGRLMSYRHYYDVSLRPLPFKIYQNLAPTPLPLDKAPLGVSALDAIARNAPVSDQAQIPDLDVVARLLYFSAGITKRIRREWGEMSFRAAACTGALYHIELYLVCGDLSGLAAGVYHFEPQANALTQLRRGDYRQILIEATAGEPAIARAPAVLVYTDVFFRNAIKYQARAYRHAFWDCGTILSHTLAMATAHQLPARVVAGFVDETVNRLLDLDVTREATLALLPVGTDPENSPAAPPPLQPLALQTEPVSPYETEIPAITNMHTASSLADAVAVSQWRGGPPDLPAPEPADDLIPLQPLAPEAAASDSLETVIMHRGSTRQFARKPITFQELSTVLTTATPGIPADFVEAQNPVLYQIYLIVNAVDGLAPGAYVYHRQHQALELLQQGDFREQAGDLGLGQDLAADASVNLFFLTDLAPILQRFGNRGYRAAQFDASITAGKVYLAAYAQGFGASGLTFYDDAVTEFFSPHAAGKSVMFMILLGRKQRSRL